MFNAQHGGLTGKARRVREAGRASRLYTQQLIAEFFDPQTGSTHRRVRPIRLGHRSEFLPSTVCALRELNGAVDSAAEPAATSSIKPIRLLRASQANAGPIPFVPASRKTRAGVQPAGPREAMTFAGFLYGCALGGAAAAVILLMLHFAVG